MVYKDNKLIYTIFFASPLTGGVIGILAVLLTRRSGSLFTWHYFTYVFQYWIVVFFLVAAVQLLILFFLKKTNVSAEFLLGSAGFFTILQICLGSFAALLLDF